ncbi:hypothetical protein Hdeb2414_s0045g00745841 [Helianthus debilis subsp. tardiflorus]
MVRSYVGLESEKSNCRRSLESFAVVHDEDCFANSFSESQS